MLKKNFLSIAVVLLGLTTQLLAPENDGSQQKTKSDKKSLQSKKSEIKNYESENFQTENLKLKSDGSSQLIELRLENTSISSVIAHLAALKGINILPNKDTTDKKISFMCQKKLTVDQAWDAMLTLIQVHGFTVVKNGEVWKVVSTKDSSGEPYRIFSSKQPFEIPDSDEIITLVYYPRSMKADQISELIQAIINEKVKSIADLEVCIVTGRASKIRNALAIIDPIDRETLKQDMKIVQLKYTKPEEVARLLNDELINSKGNDGQRIIIRSMGKKDVACFSSNVKIFPDPNKQTLILLGQKQQIEKIAAFVEKVLDMQLESASSRPIKIYEVKYRDAEELKKILLKIIKIAQQGASAKSMPFKDAVIVSTGGQGGGGQGGYSVGNKLLISCENADYPKLVSLIENLDTLKPQIVLEVMIVDVSDQLDRYLEGHIRDTGRNIIGQNTIWGLANVGNMQIADEQKGLASSISGAAATTERDTTLFTFGKTGTDTTGNLSNLWGYLYLAVSKTKSNLISQPFTIVNDNEETTFLARDTKNLPSESTVKGQVAMRSWKPQNADHTVKITPRVNAAGIVQMTIDIKVEDFGTQTGSAPVDIIQRNVTTKVFMNEGEVLFLGGLSKNTSGDRRITVPILGELPIIGNFFKQKSKNQKQESLYLFIRPSLIKPRNDEQPDDYTKLKMDYAKLNIKRSDSLIKTKDPIEKYFFRPAGMPEEKVDLYIKNEYYPEVDDFWQRKDNPVTSDIARDVYYRSADIAKMNYAKSDVEKKLTEQKLRPEASYKSYKKRPVIA